MVREEGKDIVLYPNGWYYNACVIGYMGALEYGLGREIVTSFYQADGTIRIPAAVARLIYSAPETGEFAEGLSRDAANQILKSLYGDAGGLSEKTETPILGLKRIAWWWVQQSKLSTKEYEGCAEELWGTCNQMFGLHGPYKNLFNAASKSKLLPEKKTVEAVTFFNRWFAFSARNPSDEIWQCGFCQTAVSLKKEEDSSFQVFLGVVAKNLGSSSGEFPNVFWHGQPNLLFCPVCRGILLFFHLSQGNGMFVSGSSFQVMNYINKIFQNRPIGTQSPRQQNFLLRILESDEETKKVFGVAEKFGIQIVRFDRAGLAERCIYSPAILKILLQPNIAGYVRQLKETNKQVLEALLYGHYALLLPFVYAELRRYILSESLPEQRELIKQAMLLLRLYKEIQAALKKGGHGMGNIYSMGTLQEYPDYLTKQETQLKLLELARVGEKQEIEYVITRAYVAAGIVFPRELFQVFELEGESFSHYIFSFVANVASISKKKDNEKQK